MKRILATLAMGAALLTGAAAYAAEEGTSNDAVKLDQPTTAYANPMDASTWYDAAGDVPQGHVETFNPADPESWMKFVDPKTHTKMHATFTNPAGYGQFMNPGLYMQMMNPAVWMKWMNPESYKVAMQPETMAYWMQPGAYMHGMQPTHYMQMMNPESYTKLMDSAAKAAAPTAGANGFNFFNPMAWAEAFSKGYATKNDG